MVRTRLTKSTYTCKTCGFFFEVERMDESDSEIRLTIPKTPVDEVDERLYPALKCLFCKKEKLYIPDRESLKDMRCPKCNRTFFLDYF